MSTGTFSENATAADRAAPAAAGLSKAGGYVALVFAALGVYLYASTAAVATGGRALPLGRPLLR